MTLSRLQQLFVDCPTPTIGSWTILSGLPLRCSEKVQCRCKCGVEKLVFLNSILYRGNRSCLSCAQKTHNLSANTHYSRWKHMLSRCYDTADARYKDYGGRGITVCLAWRNGLEQFISDIGCPPSREAELDRVDNNGNYEPGNVRWASSTQNNRNSSRTRKDGMHCIFPKTLKSGKVSYKVNVMLKGRYFPQLTFKTLAEARVYRDNLVSTP